MFNTNHYCVFFTMSTCTSAMYLKHSIQQLGSKQLQSHVFTIPFIVELISHIFIGNVQTCVLMPILCTSGLAGYFCSMFEFKLFNIQHLYCIKVVKIWWNILLPTLLPTICDVIN